VTQIFEAMVFATTIVLMLTVIVLCLFAIVGLVSKMLQGDL